MCYNVLDDGTQTRIRCVKAGDDGFSGPSGSIPICVNDLLKLYSALLASAKDQLAIGRTSTRDFPLKQFNHMSAKIPIHQATRGEVSYGSGWARVQLPGPMGDVGCSPPLIPKGMPMVWKGVASQLVMYHQGSVLGTLAIAILIPDTESAIVVLTNSLIQGLESEKFRLDHYEQDTFTWPEPRKDLVKRDRWVDQGAPFWKAEFKANTDGHIGSLSWVHDIGVPAAEYVKLMKRML